MINNERLFTTDMPFIANLYNIPFSEVCYLIRVIIVKRIHQVAETVLVFRM